LANNNWRRLFQNGQIDSINYKGQLIINHVNAHLGFIERNSYYIPNNEFSLIRDFLRGSLSYELQRNCLQLLIKISDIIIAREPQSNKRCLSNIQVALSLLHKDTVEAIAKEIVIGQKSVTAKFMVEELKLPLALIGSDEVLNETACIEAITKDLINCAVKLFADTSIDESMMPVSSNVIISYPINSNDKFLEIDWSEIDWSEIENLLGKASPDLSCNNEIIFGTDTKVSDDSVQDIERGSFDLNVVAKLFAALKVFFPSKYAMQKINSERLELNDILTACQLSPVNEEPMDDDGNPWLAIIDAYVNLQLEMGSLERLIQTLMVNSENKLILERQIIEAVKVLLNPMQNYMAANRGCLLNIILLIDDCFPISEMENIPIAIEVANFM
jgi:hypothetical protein